MHTKDRSILKKENDKADGLKNGGNGSKADESGKQATGSGNGAVKPGTKAEPSEPITKKLPTVANATDRLSKFEQFQKLGERFQFLKDKDRELKNFQVSQDGTLAKITLDCPGSTVLISNSTIIEKVVNLCQQELSELLSKTEKEVIEFEI